MRIDEIISGDDKFNSFMNKMQDPKASANWGFYPYVVKHPFDPRQAVTITDIPNSSAFEHLWRQLPRIIQSEFGQVTPVIVNKDGSPSQEAVELSRDRNIGNIIPMTYSQYVSVISNSLDQ